MILYIIYYCHQVALRCDAPYTRHCDVDVHFHLNRACAGRRRCAVPVSSTVFGDPCGYDEFLVVTYQCTPGQFTDLVVSPTHATRRNKKPSSSAVTERPRDASCL